jgi:hypothetical protein
MTNVAILTPYVPPVEDGNPWLAIAASWQPQIGTAPAYWPAPLVRRSRWCALITTAQRNGMNVLPKEVTEVITGTAVTGQPRSLRCHVVEPVLDQHRRGHCCCRQKTGREVAPKELPTRLGGRSRHRSAMRNRSDRIGYRIVVGNSCPHADQVAVRCSEVEWRDG